jgi:hypothetical protein
MKVTGGGIQGRNVKHVKAGKQEPVTHRANVDAVAQQGISTQFPKKPIQQGPHSGYEPKPQGSTGIANARQGHEGVGPGGGGRTIYRSGSQSPTPPAHGMPEGRKI